MKKKILIMVGSIIFVVGIILVLYFTGIIADKRDLICNRVYVETETMKEIDYTEIYFNNRGKVKEGKKVGKITYTDSVLAQESYNELVAENSLYGDSKITIEGNTISIEVPLDFGTNQEKMRRWKIKRDYEEYGYECE